ncbi:MAG TPA: lyase [Candidatus Limnocylindria bacterium]|nr:lyase [Candidatus Limnocylindria bacterium]
MRLAVFALIGTLAAVGCRPIDGGVVTRTDAPTASPVPGQTSGTATVSPAATSSSADFVLQEFAVGRGQHPHDVAPARDGGVWYTAQLTGELGWLDPKTGATKMTKLGAGSAPHGVIVGPDGAPWITDSGLNAIVRVDPVTSEVRLFKLPGPNINLNTATFDFLGVLWFTGQGGYYGFADPADGRVSVMPAPRGAGPYGIASTPRGSVFYASLAGSHIAFVDIKTTTATPIDPPTSRQGARRVWADSQGRVWVSEWNAGQLAMFDPAPAQPPLPGRWKEWKLPGANPLAYAVFVDDQDIVWLSDFGANAIVRFDPRTETFTSRAHPQPNANVRQLLGRPGEVWGAMSGQDKLVVARAR